MCDIAFLCRGVALALLWVLGITSPAGADWPQPLSVTVDWANTIAISKTTASMYGNAPRLGPIRDPANAALKNLGADYARYLADFHTPRLAVAELDPPRDGRTSWDFSLMDPLLTDFFKATAGHPVIVDFSTLPAWMWKTEKPVLYPDDPDQSRARDGSLYVQGTELVDPSAKQAAEYFVRLASWYCKGGFTDEFGRLHTSGYHFEIPYWEVLNEVESEHGTTPEEYVQRYDVIVAAVRGVLPKAKFIGLTFAHPQADAFECFLNPGNHRPGIPLDMIALHFYATPSPAEGLEQWQYSVFAQADGYFGQYRFIRSIRDRLSPKTGILLNESGIMLPRGFDPGDPKLPAAFWNLSGSFFAYLYLNLSKLGLDVLEETQLVAFPGGFPELTSINWADGRPNARYWVLKLLKDNFGAGDAIVATNLIAPFRHPTERFSSNSKEFAFRVNPDVAVQGYATARGQRRLLALNKRDRPIQLTLSSDAVGATVETVDEETGEGPPRLSNLDEPILDLAPFAVSVVTLP
jgi:hypothetical protein